MRRVFILAYSAFAIIMLVNYFYYKSLYQKQIEYISQLLDQQVRVVGLEIDNTNNYFVSDLTRIQDFDKFFDRNKPEIRDRVTDQLKLFYSKYGDFVIKIRIYDAQKNEFTITKDEENEWIPGSYISLTQRKIEGRELLVQSGSYYDFYNPILSGGNLIGNIIVTVDYRNYFQNLFSKYNLKNYQWQWVVSDSGTVIYDNYGDTIEYSQIGRITEEIGKGSVSNIIHSAREGGNLLNLISSYYSTQLLQRDFGIIFSAHTGLFQKYIIRNSVFIVIGTLLLIQLIILIFWLHMRSQQREVTRLRDSEKVLLRLIEEMPVGVIIHNRNREILKANKVAAGFYAFASENDMVGKIFPETAVTPDNDYFARHLGGTFRPDQFVIIKKEIGEIVLYRSSIQAKYMDEEATLEILIDVTLLESARRQEAMSNTAKSEFLARMSYEIRTPLNGIIGMTDVLSRSDLSPDVHEIVNLLRRSTKVLLEIINDILDFSKIESGKMIMEETPFNVREEIYYAIDLAKPHIGDKPVEIECIVDEKTEETLIGDPFRLRQVLVNLINHSVSNTEKGLVRITCRQKSVSKGIVTLQFEILDTGRSFDKAAFKKIFGDFVDAESMSFRNTEESVFATIIARRLIELMGGILQASSPSGLNGSLGSRIVFTVNTYLNERIEKLIDNSEIKNIRQVKTLVITGSQSRDEEFHTVLHKAGLPASVTSFQKTTINQLKANLSSQGEKYRLVIIAEDPDFDGFEVVSALHESKLYHSFIIIFVTGNDRKGNLVKCIANGVDHYMIKPIDTVEMLNVLKSSFTFLETTDAVPDMSKIRRDLRILIVEDNRMNQIVLVKMLKSLGYDCDVAEDGYEGMMKAKEKKFDIIFMDLVMPEMDGYETTKKILELDKSYFIVAFTADNMPESRKKAELSGIKEFISKPVRIEELKKLFAMYFS